ncbi:uncharacterized protein Nkd [Anoplolepis gracilipes]|uniref:uncharacterized protein Nkd n=1 Tax=Anoplolepis gracilipes TaxID=354296 RepID=UPI003BA36407
MATGLVKWWRARFLAGYRPFSVVGTNTEGSDSEELLTGVPTTCNVSSPPTTESQPTLISPAEPPQVAVDGSSVPAAGPTGNDEQPTCGTTKQLSFEEFECDVSVAEGDRRRQEFSFTLYDFDGHGKITKDDIAGLVTTIYDTLGASIQVPPCGSKTIKVKLTVSPDQRTSSSSSQTPRNPATGAGLANATQTSQTTTTTTTTLPDGGHQHGSSSCCHLKHAVPCSHATVTAAATTRATARHCASRVPRRRRATRYRCQTERKEVETHSEDDDENTRANRVQQEELRRRVGPVPHLPSPYSNSSEGDVSDDSDTSPAFSPLTPLLTTNQRKRSGALQRQQLLEIIQANMEKNNLSFHTSRKRHQNEQPRIPSHSPHLGTSNHNNQDYQASVEPRQAAVNYHKPIRENTTTHNSVSFPKTPAKSRTANLMRKARHTTPRNNTVHSSPQTTYSQMLNRNVIVPTTAVYNDSPQHTTHRNIVNLVPNNNQTANHQTITNNHNNLQRNDAQFAPSQQCGRSKKHQLKHATREQDQARAMAQVVRWLEREFSQSAVAATSSRRHVHEHIHHHYHHYHAEALV